MYICLFESWNFYHSKKNKKYNLVWMGKIAQVRQICITQINFKIPVKHFKDCAKFCMHVLYFLFFSWEKA